jgi:ribonuclease P protein component
MIPRKLRLPKTRIKYLLKKGKKLADQYFILKFWPNGPENKTSRFAVIISTAVHPKAVKRNYIRRQIYEIFRLENAEIKKNCDIICIGKTTLTKIKYGQIRKNLVSLFKKIA